MYMYTCVRVTYAYEHIQNAYMYMADHVYFNMYTFGRNAYMYTYIKISYIYIYSVHITHTYSHTCARVLRCAHYSYIRIINVYRVCKIKLKVRYVRFPDSNYAIFSN